MADTFGALQLPAPTTDSPIGDPALGMIGGFIRGAINNMLSTAWAALRPASIPSDQPLVRELYLFDPKLRNFNVTTLPALFVYRGNGVIDDAANDWLTDASETHALFLLPLLAREESRVREQFLSAIVKVVAAALNKGRDPGWYDPNDPDKTAIGAPADDDAFILSTSTSTNPITFSGAALNGVLGDSALAPRRNLTITTELTEDPAYNTTDPIVVTFVGHFGATSTKTMTLTSPTGGETLLLGTDVAQLASLAEPAMLSTEGAIKVGVAPFKPRGSSLRERANLERIDLVSYNIGAISVRALDGDESAIERLGFVGVDMRLAVREVLKADPSNTSRFPFNGPIRIDADFTHANGDVIESITMPQPS